MDNEQKILMTVDTGNSVKTIADLKDQIKELKKALDQEAVGSEAAKKASDDLTNAQNLLKQAVKGSTDVMNIAKGSYYDLNKQCEKLKVTYKSMADGIEKNKIAEKIAKLQDELKKQDAAIGDFKRNVGDYANSFTSALSSMGLGTTTLSKGLGIATNASNSFKGALDALKAHPIILVIAALVLVIKKLVDAFKNNEEAVNKLKVAMGPFQGLVDAISTAVGKLVDLIANGLVKAFSAAASAAQSFIGWLQKMAEKLGMDDLANSLQQINDKMEAGAEIAKQDVALQQKARDVRKQNAEAQRDIAKLETEFRKAAGDTVKQKEIAAEIEKKRQGILQRNYDLAKAEYELEKKKGDQAPNSTADNERLLAAEEKMLAAEAELYKVSREQAKVWKAEATELKANSKELEINAQKRQDLISELNIWAEEQSEILTRINKEYEKNLALLNDNDFDAIDKLTKRWQAAIKKAQEEITRKQVELDLFKVGDNSSAVTEENVRFNLYKAENERIEEEALNHQHNLLDIQIQGLEERREALNELINDTEMFNKLSIEQQNKYKDEYENVVQQIKLIDSERTLNETEQIRLREKQRRREVKMMFAIANGIADIFQSIADSMDESNKKQFEAAKAFNIAGATIQMLTGIATALAGAFTTKSGPWDIALAAVQAASIAASGGATIAQIARQQYNDGGSGASAASTAINASSGAINAINAPVQYTSAVEGAAITDEITNQKVIVVESDISDTINKVRVEESENRF